MGKSRHIQHLRQFARFKFMQNDYKIVDNSTCNNWNYLL